MLKALTLLAANEMGVAVRRNVNGWILYASGAVLALLGLVFFLDALRDWLLLRMTVIEANLAIGGGLLLVACGLALAGWFIKNRKRETSLTASTALITLPLAARMAGTRLTLGTIAIGAVVAAGTLLGRSLVRASGDKR
jgi:Pyruvate/2-oxoacid:ferredoxin oxidoreductase gamma subunit